MYIVYGMCVWGRGGRGRGIQYTCVHHVFTVKIPKYQIKCDFCEHLQNTILLEIIPATEKNKTIVKYKYKCLCKKKYIIMTSIIVQQKLSPQEIHPPSPPTPPPPPIQRTILTPIHFHSTSTLMRTPNLWKVSSWLSVHPWRNYPPWTTC